jgi:hypothetical protein
MYPYRHCPHCGGELPSIGEASPPRSGRTEAAVTRAKTYNQDAVWKAIVAKGEKAIQKPPLPIDLAKEATSASAARLASLSDADSLVHILFDKPITPDGGLLYTALMGSGKGPAPESLKARGYVLDAEGHVVMVDETPIGRGYRTLQYWGGEKQHRRWHLAEPITINPSRHGDPLFMDAEMVCFGAKWRDGERFEDALTSLLGLFIDGFENDGHPLTPLVLEVVWR